METKEITKEQVQEYQYKANAMEEELERLENLDLVTIAKLVKKRKQEIREWLIEKINDQA